MHLVYVSSLVDQSWVAWPAFVPAMLCFLCVPDNNGSAPTVSSCSLTWHIRSSSSSIRFDLSSAPIAVTQGSRRLLLRVLLCRITMVTTRSRRTSSSDSLKVNNQVTLHRSDAHCTSGGFSIEQQALLDSLSASRQVTHALLRRIWNRLDTYSELLLSVAGHIQPTAPPRSPRARSI
ncbi:unnamed protein product [Prunus armeniaca]|uniref:Uncharacterized protein n=1 Tax=Prunus armeniaca TaxID=36596 RepID=A0A6J5VYZ7_PRUAR|nr:unnamed protein product [Prunus armeniaca]